MLHDDKGYQLTPASDLLPNIFNNQEHVLRFGLSATAPNADELLKLGKQYNLKTTQAKIVINEVTNAVSEWKKVFTAYEVPDHEIERLTKDIELRITGVTNNRVRVT